MKYVGHLHKIPVYQSEDCPPDQIYLINGNHFFMSQTRRKDGQPDMRYKINKFMKFLHSV